eukprot:TRINITY_DN6078_c0_g2_i1.p1 TRINITY_DN6078_c0_g2~~TRINITY_DN6078_c0_g2_i1.p1  ORF type:complete len:1132 (-),score=209.64 TRINITY_DN6078_c0_g2_i1:306-3701(-)
MEEAKGADPPDLEELSTLLQLPISLLVHREELNACAKLCASVPCGLSRLSRLRWLSLSRNQLSTLPESLDRLILLQDLILSENQLQYIPPFVLQLASLKYLDISMNQFSALPYTVSLLTSLTYFSASNNKLESLPESITCLSRLRHLALHKNKLTVLPMLIGALSDMTSLSLQENQLTSLPDTIGRLTSLRDLCISKNFLSVLPDCIGQFSLLESLDVSQNQLIAIPESIGRLTSLHVLHLWMNKVQVLPNSLGLLSSVKNLMIEGNALTYPPQNIVRLGSSALLEFLRAACEGTDLWRQGRILLIGEQATGKTTLSKSLLQKAFRFSSTCTDQSVATMGAEIIQEKLEIQTPKEKLNLTVWDFGGQSEFQITHPFFLSSGALVLLIWNSTLGPKDSKMVEWLTMISSVAPGTRVIPVGTNLDALPSNRDAPIFHDMESDLLEIIDKFRHTLLFEDNVFISNKTGEGITHLKTCISNTLLKLDNINCPIPKAYLQLKDFAEGLAKTRDPPICTFEEFTQKTSDLAPTLSATNILRFLHDLGVVVWHNTPLLSDKIVCSPEYLIKIFLQVFSFVRSSFDVGAYSQVELLEQYEQIFPNMSQFVQNIFRHFLLSFPTENGYEVFPALSPVGVPPESVWPTKAPGPPDCFNSTTYVFHYEIFPRALFGHITSKLHKCSLYDRNPLAPDFFSGSHMIFYMSLHPDDSRPEFHVSLEHFPDDPHIVLRVRSCSPARDSWEAVQRIVQQVQDVHQTFPGVMILHKEYLVCPKCMDKGSSDFLESCSIPMENPARETHGKVCEHHKIHSNDWKSYPSDWLAPSHSQLPSQSIPTLFWVQAGEQIECSSSWRLHLLCDRPNTPHTTRHEGIALDTPSSFLKDHLNLIATNAKILRLCNPSIPATLIGHVATDAPTLISAARLMETVLGRLLETSARLGSTCTEADLDSQAELSDLGDRDWPAFLAAADPSSSWSRHLEETRLPSGQIRWLCAQCRLRLRPQNPTAIAPLGPSTALQGILWKLGGRGKVKTKWQMRYCVLDDKKGSLIYYKDAKDTSGKPVGEILLHGCTPCEYDTGEGASSFGFAIPTLEKTYCFKSDSNTTRNQWLAAIYRISTGSSWSRLPVPYDSSSDNSSNHKLC